MRGPSWAICLLRRASSVQVNVIQVSGPPWQSEAGKPSPSSRTHAESISESTSGQLLQLRATTCSGIAPAAQELRGISDLEIVAGMARGEDWAADALYDRVHVVVDRTLRRVLRSYVADQDDLVQIVFEKLVIALTQRRLSEDCNLAAWASVISTRAAIDLLRQRARERRFFEHSGDADDCVTGACLERQLEARATVQRFHRALGRLVPKYAEAVILHDVLGHDLKEIADATAVSIAAAQSRLVRGRKALVARLHNEGLAR